VKAIVEALNLSEEEVVRALEVGGTVSLDSMASGEDGENGSLYSMIADDEDKYEDFEVKETLRAAMKDFSDTEKALVKYRYMDALSQTETAKRLGVSQMFVSRMERKVLAKLKEILKDSI
jgi:RNA polymerase sigma-B factor